MQQSLLHQPSKLFCVFCVFRGNILSSHRIHGIHRIDWQRMFSHRIHGIHRIDWQRVSSHRIHRIHRIDWQRMSSHRIHGIHRSFWRRRASHRCAQMVRLRRGLPRNAQKLLVEDILPRISQMPTDL